MAAYKAPGTVGPGTGFVGRFTGFVRQELTRGVAISNFAPLQPLKEPTMKFALPLLLLAAAPAYAAPAAPASCPQVTEQLSEYLASAKQRIGHDGEVRVEFEVGVQGRAQIVALDGSRNYRASVRTAVDSLDCERGTPQRYVLNIRFTDPMNVLAAAPAAAASGNVAQVSDKR